MSERPGSRAAIEHRDDAIFTPFPGFQTEACAAGEDEVFLGGAKGPGKTEILVALATRQIQYPTYKGWLLRSTYGEVQELIDRSHQMYPKLPERPEWNAQLRRWSFPSGARITLSYCETVEDAEQLQGKEPNFIGWDEFGKAKDPRAYEKLLGELRSKDKRVRCQMLTTGNPGQRNHNYIKRRFIDTCGLLGGRCWFRFRMPNGTVAYKSRRWIPGSVWDNPIYANDPSYIAQLMSMNERDRKYLLDGSWDSPEGSAFSELDARVHLVKPFLVPSAWNLYAGHDWGYQHPWCVVMYAVDEDGYMWVVDTVWGRRDQDSQIAIKVASRLPVDRIKTTWAGSDCFSKHTARREEDDAPTTAERYLEHAKWSVTRANTARVDGAKTLRELLAWRGIGPDGSDAVPLLRFMDTPGNRRLFQQLEALTIDPDDPEDVLKIDATPEMLEKTPWAGDDGYDSLRYAVHSRPRAGRETYKDRRWSMWDPMVLQYEAELKKRGIWNQGTPLKPLQAQRGTRRSRSGFEGMG